MQQQRLLDSARCQPTDVATRPIFPRSSARQLGLKPSQHQQVTRAAAKVQPSTAKAKTRTKDDLNDPAQIGASGTHSVRVNEFLPPVSLSQYMMLPVEQYFVLDPSRIRHLGGSRFLLKVQRIEILGAWLEPEVEISVVTQASPPRVILQADACRIRGSELIENMRVDQRFALNFVTELSWKSAVSPNGAGNGSQGSAMMVGQGEIMGKAKVDVWSEVIPPFNLMPREVLQGSCNVVMNGLLGSFLPLFMRLLAEDYEKWAKDGQYRGTRAMRKIPLS